MKSTGERIKALLNEKKMTQRQLAELSGITESAISHYIKGDRIPSGVASVNIAYALKYNNQLYFRQGRFIRFFKRKTNSRTK